MNEEHDSAHRAVDPSEDVLGGLRLGRPDPALRQRTLSAVHTALAASASEPVPRWRVWRLEAALASAIVACALLLPALGRFPAESQLSSPADQATPSVATLVEPLDLDGLEPYIRYRLALARRNPDPEPRYSNNEITSRIFDVY